MKCEFCCESFKDQDALNMHLRERHQDKVKRAIFEHPLKPKAKGKKRVAKND